MGETIYLTFKSLVSRFGIGIFKMFLCLTFRTNVKDRGIYLISRFIEGQN